MRRSLLCTWLIAGVAVLGASNLSAQTIQFGVIGDYGQAGQKELDVSNLVHSWNPDFIITTGDNNYPTGSAATIQANIGDYYGDYITNSLATNRFYPALGNHDWGNVANNPTGADPYKAFFTLPGNERYYDYVKGSVHFFVIDSDANEPDGISSHKAQGRWLKSALGASTSTFNVVYMHHAPYSSSSDHGSQKALQWQYKQWGATSVMAGHDHDFERLSIGGIPYFVNGVGGNPTLYPFGTPVAGSQFRDASHWGAQKITATNTQMTFDFYSTDGVLRDTHVQAAPVGATLMRTFQQDFVEQGITYTGTQDTYLISGSPAANAQGSDGIVVTDNSPVNQGLIRFNSLFGGAANQVPAGATITQATLTIVTGPSSANNDQSASTISLHRMLAGDFNESSTWNSMTNGVSTDGVEASSVAEDSTVPNLRDIAMHFDVTSTLQAWSNDPSSNRGWALINTGTDGWRFNSSESADTFARPMLEIRYAVPEPTSLSVLGLVAFALARRPQKRIATQAQSRGDRL